MKAQIIIPTDDSGYIFTGTIPPLGAVSLATILKEELGLYCPITNFELRPQKIDYHADVTLISTIVANYKNSCRLAKELKRKKPKALVGMGGPYASNIPNLVLENQRSVDFVGSGLGEEIVLQLLSGRDWDSINNITFRKNGKIISTKKSPIDINSTPIPDWDLIEIQEYFRNWQKKITNSRFKGTIPILSQVGCLMHCLWCTLYDKKISIKSPERVAEEITLLYNKFGPEYRIYDISSNFPTDIEWTRQLQKELRKRLKNEKPNIYVYSQVKDITSERVEILSDTFNWLGFFLGVESGSERILWEQKGITRKQVEEAMKIMKKYKAYFNASFVIGHEKETSSDLEETIKCAQWMGKSDNSLGIFPYELILMPGSRAYKKLTDRLRLTPTDCIDPLIVRNLQELWYSNFTDLKPNHIEKALRGFKLIDAGLGGGYNRDISFY